MINYNSTKEIDGFLASHGLVPQKRFGQNFLVNSGARRLLLSEALKDNPHSVWEIGPGIGTLTSELAGSCEVLTLFEIDAGFVRLLTREFADNNGVRIVEGDFIRTWKSILDKEGFPDVIVGNLPYNAAALIVLELFAAESPSKLIFTVQSEVADRMLARASTPSYSSYSIICQAGWRMRRLLRLKPGSFYPRPRVDSTLVELLPQESSGLCSREFFLDFCRCLFLARRKTIRNNINRCATLSALSKQERMDILGANAVSPDARAETLSPDVAFSLAGSFFGAIFSSHPQAEK